jgi:hypothetical protein
MDRMDRMDHNQRGIVLTPPQYFAESVSKAVKGTL